MMVPASRRLLLAAPLLLASCGDDTPLRQDFPELHFDFLTPLRLNVATLVMGDVPAPGPLDQQNPAPPIAALQRMAQDRLSAAGSAGRAVFVVDTASITRASGGLEGVMAVHLDVLTTEGTRSAFAEARVSRSYQGSLRDLRGRLYDLTRRMMDDMNVEFEFQVRRSLRDWLQTTSTAPTPSPVQRQDLSAPRS